MNKPGKGTIPIKTHKSIWDNYQLLKNKQYTEKHIKELLIDLRFVANQAKKTFENSPYENDMGEFIDFCNFIAHPVKHRGFISNRILENIDLLQQSLIDPSEYITFEDGDIYLTKLKPIQSENMYSTSLQSFVLHCKDKQQKKNYYE